MEFLFIHKTLKYEKIILVYVFSTGFLFLSTCLFPFSELSTNPICTIVVYEFLITIMKFLHGFLSIQQKMSAT